MHTRLTVRANYNILSPRVRFPSYQQDDVKNPTRLRIYSSAFSYSILCYKVFYKLYIFLVEIGTLYQHGHANVNLIYTIIKRY